MFKKTLHDKLDRIFQFKKTSLNAPSDSFEQDVLFVEIEKASTRVSDGKIHGKVEGTLIAFSHSDNLTYGYFPKRISRAEPADIKDFFFYDIELDIASSPSRMQNIHERRTKFIYFFSEQYDPARGQITSVNFVE